MAIQDLTASLDLKQNLNIYTTCKQFDNLNLILSIFDNSLQADLTNYDVRLRAMKADNVPLIQEHIGIDIDGNIVNIQADAQLTTTAGNTPIELQFIDKSTGEKKATFNLVLVVVASAIAIEASISKATYTLLKELEDKLDQLSDFFEHIGEAIEANTNLENTIANSETAKNNLDGSINTANTSKIALDTSNTNATNTKNALDTLNTTANNTKNALNTVNQTGQNLLDSLETFEQEHADVTDISNQLANVNTQLSDMENKQGDITQLNTTDKSSVVNAVKEVKSQANTNQLNITTNTTNIATHTSQIASLASGAPKAVSLVSQMTDTAKNYVYTGSESGYISGDWYYHNGSEFVSGGVYQSTGVADKSVTYNKVEDTIQNMIDYFTNINEKYYWESGTLDGQGANLASTIRIRTIISIPSNVSQIVAKNGYEFHVERYTTTGTFIDEVVGWFSNYSNFDHSNYHYRIVLRNANNTTATINVSECVNIIFIDNSNTNNYLDIINNYSNSKNILFNESENDITANCIIKPYYMQSDGNIGDITQQGKTYQTIYIPLKQNKRYEINVANNDVFKVGFANTTNIGQCAKYIGYITGSSYIIPSVYAYNTNGDNYYNYMAIFVSQYGNVSSFTVTEKSYSLNANILALENKRLTPSTIIVAGNDSTDEDKSIANYICDGVNDEIELQSAIDDLKTTGGRVLLCRGNYYIDSLYDSTNAIVGKFGLYISNTHVQHNIILEGLTRPIRKLNTSAIIGDCACINLTKTAYDSLGNSEILTVIGALPSNISNATFTYPAINMTIKNIGVNVYSNQKPIKMISGEYCSNMQVDGFLGSILTSISTYAVSECIGIRGLDGWNFGEGYRIDNCFIWGMDVAYDISGEHLIMQDCGCRNCNIPYRFNGYGTEAKMSHPNTLINCCDENCIKGPYFCTSTRNMCVDFIDYNIEVRSAEGFPKSKYAVEETPGSFCGSISYVANLSDYINKVDLPFWEDGSGINFRTTNLAHKQSGTTNERLTYKANLNQQYFDTTLNKVVYFINGSWVDSNGIII